MKGLLALSIALLLLFAGCSENETEKTQTEELSHIQFMDGEGNPGGKRIYKYNMEGQTADMSVSNSLGDSVLYESYAYDSDGNMIKKNVYSETEHELHIYTYRDGLLETEEITSKEISKGQKSKSEDAESAEERASAPYRLDEYNYDSEGRLDFIEARNAEGVVSEVKRYVYDDDGRVKKERIFGGSGEYLGGTEFTYESEGDNPILKEYVGSASEKYSKEEMTYKGDKLVKTVRYDKSGRLSEVITIEYDEKDRRSLVTRSNADGETDAINKYYYENYISLIG